MAWQTRGIITEHPELMGDNGGRLALTSLPGNLNTVNNVADADVTLMESVAVYCKVHRLSTNSDVQQNITKVSFFPPTFKQQ